LRFGSLGLQLDWRVDPKLGELPDLQPDAAPDLPNDGVGFEMPETFAVLCAMSGAIGGCASGGYAEIVTQCHVGRAEPLLSRVERLGVLQASSAAGGQIPGT